MEKKTMIAAGVVVVVIVAAIVAIGIISDNNEIRITFDGNGGVDSEGRSSYVLTQDNVIDPILSFTKADEPDQIAYYWNTERDGSGTTYNHGDKVSSSITLYAQWGYRLDYVHMATNETITLDGKDLGESQGIPLSGSATLYLEKGDGQNWTYTDNGVFTRTEGSQNVSVTFSFTGATTTYSVSDGRGVIQIEYDGTVTLDVTWAGDI